MGQYDIKNLGFGKKDKNNFLIHWHIEDLGFGSLHFEKRKHFIFCDNDGIDKDLIYEIIDCFFDWILIREDGINPISFSTLNISEICINDIYKSVVENKTNHKELKLFIKDFKEKIIIDEDIKSLSFFLKLQFKDALKRYESDLHNLCYQYHLSLIIEQIKDLKLPETNDIKDHFSLSEKIEIVKKIYN